MNTQTKNQTCSFGKSTPVFKPSAEDFSVFKKNITRELSGWSWRSQIQHLTLLIEHAAKTWQIKYLKWLRARKIHEQKLHYRLKFAARREKYYYYRTAEEYKQQYGFGSHKHRLLNKLISDEVGCDVSFGDICDSEESWDEEEEGTAETVQIKVPICSTCRHRSCDGEFCDWLSRPVEPKLKEKVVVRDSILALQLSYKIYFLRLNRSSLHIRLNSTVLHSTKYEVLQKSLYTPQMMEQEHAGPSSTIEAGNVVISEENATEPAIATTPDPNNLWASHSSSEVISEYTYLTERYMYFKTLEWNTTHTQNTELPGSKVDLPYDFINSVSKCNVPMFIPFHIYRYSSFDMHIKIHLNANKFQVGQLQFAFQYLEKFDDKPFTNVYSRSQLPHVIVDTGSNNEAELVIPFRHIKPFVHNAQRSKYYDCLYIGTLKAYVIAPLRVVGTTPSRCNVNMFVKFSNCKFAGMRDGSLVEPQMMSIAAGMVANKVIDKVIGDVNCDNPTSSSQPRYLVPTASHSWSIGSGISEHLHNLRLENISTGTGRTGIDTSESSIGVPCRTFGMIKPFKWETVDSKKNVPGYLLFSCDASPQLEKDLLFSIKHTGSSMDEYAMPPVGVVSGLYQYWRGSLEFRFDFVTTSFHTGEVLIAYIPGKYTDVTLEQARNSPHATFTLKDTNSFTFNVPYIADKPWWYRKYGGPQRRTEFASPSRIYMFVTNPLIPNEAVVDSIDIIPYIRAGNDFEVSVPVQPAYGCSYNLENYVPVEDFLTPTASQEIYWVDKASNFADGKKAVLCYGVLLNQFVDFRFPSLKLSKKEYVVFSVNNIELSCDMMISGVRWKVGYVVAWAQAGKDVYFGVPFPNTDVGLIQAKKVAESLLFGDSTDKIYGNMYDFEDGSINKAHPSLRLVPKIYTSTRSKFNSFISKLHKIIETDSDTDEDDIEIVDPQGEDKVDSSGLLMPLSSLASTGSGKMTFNENFSDLKDLCRRYQKYISVEVPLDTKFPCSTTFLQFPIVPRGLNLNVESNNFIWNQLRDGPIPLILNGYIFGRGSLRLKIVVSINDSPSMSGKIWVQHRPDMPLDSKATYITYPNISRQDRFMNHGYANYVQSLNINQILELEIPFYQPGMYTFLPKATNTVLSTDFNDYVSLGDIAIGLDCCLVKNVQCKVDVYYSLGDDFSFSTFRGFNPIVFCDEIFEPQMFSTLGNWVGSGIVGGASAALTNKLLNNPIEHLTNKLKETVHTQVHQTAVPLIDQVVDELKKTQTVVQSEAVEWFKNTATTTCIGNLMHVLANPTLKTVAISLANVLITIVSGSLHVLTTLVTALKKFFRHTWHLFTGRCRNQFNHQMEDESLNEHTKTLLSVLFTLAASALSYNNSSKPNGFFNLMRDINVTVGLSNNVFTFLKNCSSALNYFMQWILIKIKPESRLSALLANDIPDVKDWFEEVKYLLDARNKPKYVYSKSMMARVFDACVFGSMLISNGLDKSLPGGKVIWDSYKEICKLRNDMIERGSHPDVRFETFPIWFHGPPGIGKSYLTTELVNKILLSINYSGVGSPIYYITPGLKHWSGVQQPVALVSDDMFQVKGTRMEEELANLFCICSSSVLNPPMAAVEDKERRLNPLLYIMHCNYAFPELESVSRCPEAVYRRRKLLIEVDLTQEIKDKYPNLIDASQISKSELVGLSHLRFRFALNPKDKNTIYSDWLNYNEISTIICSRFMEHYENERDNFKKRMINMYKLDPDFNTLDLLEEVPEIQNCISLSEKIRAYKTHIQMELDSINDTSNLEPVVLEYIKSYYARAKAKITNFFFPEMGNSKKLRNKKRRENILKAELKQLSDKIDYNKKEEIPNILQPLDLPPPTISDCSDSEDDINVNSVNSNFIDLNVGILDCDIQINDTVDNPVLFTKDEATNSVKDNSIPNLDKTCDDTSSFYTSAPGPIIYDEIEEIDIPIIPTPEPNFAELNSFIPEHSENKDFKPDFTIEEGLEIPDDYINMEDPFGLVNQLDDEVLAFKNFIIKDTTPSEGKKEILKQLFYKTYIRRKKYDEIILDNKYLPLALLTQKMSSVSKTDLLQYWRIYTNISPDFFSKVFDSQDIIWDKISKHDIYLNIPHIINKPACILSEVESGGIRVAMSREAMSPSMYHLLSFGSFLLGCKDIRSRISETPRIVRGIHDIESLANYLRQLIYIKHNITVPKNIEVILNIINSGDTLDLSKLPTSQRRAVLSAIVYTNILGMYEVSKIKLRKLFGYDDADESEENLKRKMSEMLWTMVDCLDSTGVVGCSCKCERLCYLALTNIDSITYCSESNSLYCKDSFMCNTKLVCLDEHNVCYHDPGDVRTYNDSCLLRNSFFQFLLVRLYNLNRESKFTSVPVTNFITTHYVTSYKPDFLEAINFLDTHKDSWTCWWQHHVQPWIGYVMYGLVFFIPMIIYLASFFFQTPEYDSKEEYQGAQYSKLDSAHPQKHKEKVPTVKTFTGQANSHNQIQIIKAVEHNSVIIKCTWVKNKDRIVRSARCLALYGRTLLVLRHYIEEFTAHYTDPEVTGFVCTIYFNSSGKVSFVEVPYEDLLETIAWLDVKDNISYSNYGFLQLPTSVHMFKDISKYFATQNMHAHMGTKGDLLCSNDVNSYDLTLTKNTQFVISPSANSSAINLDLVYTYHRQSPGLCGSVLVVPYINNGGYAIVGLHVAGNQSTNVGVAEPLLLETIKSHKETFKSNITDIDTLPIVSVEEDTFKVQLDSNLIIYGSVSPTMEQRANTKSLIIPSLLHGKIYPVKTQINPLKPGDPRQPPGSHPLRDGCNKHGSGIISPFSKKFVDLAYKDILDSYEAIVKPVRLEIVPLTLEQAVCGDIKVPYFEPLNWSSSEGFPLIHERPNGVTSKKWLFDLTNSSNGYILNSIHPKLQQELDYRQSCYEATVKPVTIYTDCLKDARLPPEKCAIPGKTRIFSGAPVQCSIDFKMYINDFCASFKNSRINNGSAIGINPDSTEWTQLVNYLSEVGPHIITLDYSNFGPCLMSQIVAKSCNLIVDWYTINNASSEHCNRVKFLLETDIINPVHICSNVLYETINGIASGSPLTGEINSISNLLYIRCIYLEIMSNLMPYFATMFWFSAFVRVVVYGDDVIMSVNEKIIDYFNAKTISEYFLNHGIVVTNASKTQEIKPWQYLPECTFLKRGFLKHPYRSGVWLAPINMDSVTETLNWIKKSPDNIAATLVNVEASLNLAYSHGPHFYSFHYEKIRKKLVELNINFKYKTWHEIDNEYFGSSTLSIDDIKKIKIALPSFMDDTLYLG